jgi:hypothetical protein
MYNVFLNIVSLSKQKKNRNLITTLVGPPVVKTVRRSVNMYDQNFPIMKVVHLQILVFE